MRVLAACSLGGSGHLEPLLPFLAAARRGGHETLVVGPPTLTDMVEASGHPFSAGGEPPEADVAPIREQLPRLPASEASVLANRELFGRLATAAMLPAMERIVATWRPDLVLRDPCEYASAVVAPQRGVATAQIRDEPRRGRVGVDRHGCAHARVAPAGPAGRAPSLALRDAVPGVDRPLAVPDTRRFRAPRGEGDRPLPDWWNGSRAPLVYVSFGTVLGHMTMAADVYRTAIDAVAGIDARVLLTVGRGFDPEQLDDLPAHVHVERWVDQAVALGEAEVVVCHGGSGTTFGALAAGVPVVIVPLFADQFANGTKVTEAGAGIVVERGRAGPGGGRHPLGRGDAPRSPRRSRQSAPKGPIATGRSAAAQMGSAPAVDTLLDELGAG